MNEKVKIGDVLKKYREEKGVSLAVVEAETGVSRSYINRLERSSRSNPTLESVSRLVKYFGIPFSTLEEICGCSTDEEDSIQNLDYLLLNEKYMFANIIADINLKIALRDFVTELENYCTVANITRQEETKLLDLADVLRGNLLGM